MAETLMMPGMRGTRIDFTCSSEGQCPRRARAMMISEARREYYADDASGRGRLTTGAKAAKYA